MKQKIKEIFKSFYIELYFNTPEPPKPINTSQYLNQKRTSNVLNTPMGFKPRSKSDYFLTSTR